MDALTTTTTTPADMGHAIWTALLGQIITLTVCNLNGDNSHYTGRLDTLRPNTGAVVLGDVTRTRLSGAAAGETHRIARRSLSLVDVTTVAWIGVA